jgi:hypothetical protein
LREQYSFDGIFLRGYILLSELDHATAVERTNGLDLPKEDRVEEFLRRLAQATAAASFEEAYELLCRTLNAVEDQLTTIPFDPQSWQTDGRLYPPEMDNARAVEGHENVKRFRCRGHNTFIAVNGAIEIRAVRGDAVLFKKDGMDGHGVWDV